MRIAGIGLAPLGGWPEFPPLLAAHALGGRSAPHAHHAMHLVLATEGQLTVHAKGEREGRRAAGVLTAPDVPHAIEASGLRVLLVFLDPESDVGRTLRGALSEPIRLLDDDQRRALLADAVPADIMRAGGVAFTARVVEVLGAGQAPVHTIHPAVRKVLRHLRTLPAESDTSLAALAETVGLSSGRLMHVFTESIGIPLRRYLAWVRLQRACAAIAMGSSLTDAAVAAGFSDSAHMSRTFRKMFGMTPSMMQPVRSSSGQEGSVP